MADPNKGKYKILYMKEFNMAKDILHHCPEGFEWSNADYEVFKFKECDVTLVFYPHKTSAGNYHLRVRNQNSANEKLAESYMDLLNECAPGCTFSRKAK